MGSIEVDEFVQVQGEQGDAIESHLFGKSRFFTEFAMEGEKVGELVLAGVALQDDTQA